MKDYKKLDKSESYDHETVEELAEAMMELRTLERRANFLHELIAENDDLRQFVWTTAEGVSLPHHKIEDDHFKNILTHLVHSGRPISKALKAEARRRGIDVPDEPIQMGGLRRAVLQSGLGNQIIDIDDC